MAAIRHIEFWAANLEETLAFYGEVLGKLGWLRADTNGFASEGVKIYFLEQAGLMSGARVSGPRHICFTAAGKERVDAIAQLSAVKPRILHGPGELHQGGSYMLVFTDPDGYIVEVAYKKE